MALLFRINVISKSLTSICCSFTHTSLPPSHCPRRCLFTNSCSIYFSKKKVDELKTPRCPDFEQYFTKTKKGDDNKNGEINVGKENDNKRKPIVQPPIFGGQTTKSPPRTIADKKSSVTAPEKKKGVNVFPMKVPTTNEKKSTSTQPSSDQTILTSTKLETTPQPSPDHTKPISSKLLASDKKGSLAKSLNEFTQFLSLPKSAYRKSVFAATDPPESKANDTPAQSPQTIDDANGTISKLGVLPTDGDNSKKTKWNRKNILLAVTAAAIGAIGLSYLMKKSTSDVVPTERIKENKGEMIKTENKVTKCPLILPKKVPYLIIGGGTASWSAFRAIKDHVPNAKVLVVSNETHPPYMRPPLSKDMWSSATNSTANSQLDRIYFEPSDFYTDPMQLLNQSNGGVSILTNRTAKYMKLCERKVVLSDGTEIEYEECLLATGSTPRNLLVFQTAPLRIRNKISFFRSLYDFQSAKDIVDKSESIAVIGGGFLASELSLAITTYAANNKKLKVYQIFHENGNMGMTLPRYLSDWIKKKLTDYGLFVMSNTQIDSVQYENKKLKLGLLSGQVVVVDHVIVAVGTQPDVAFAQRSGLRLASGNCGIVVNDNLEALPHLYVAGDAACIPGCYGKETQTSYDNAIASGRLAGENMAGQRKSFINQSMFSSNVAPGISFESVGLIDSALKTVGIFSNGSNLTTNIDNTNKGVVFYIKNDKVVGILLWNIFNKINIARQVIAEGKKVYDLNDVAKFFEIRE